LLKRESHINAIGSKFNFDKNSEILVIGNLQTRLISGFLLLFLYCLFIFRTPPYLLLKKQRFRKNMFIFSFVLLTLCYAKELKKIELKKQTLKDIGN